MDERLPEAERKEFTPTPKQMLYGQRADLVRIVATEKDESGRVTAGIRRGRVEGVPSAATGRKPLRLPGVQPARWRTASSTRSTPARTTGTAYWCGQVVEGLCRGEPNALYDRLVHPPPPGDGAGSPGQAAFLAGLDAFQAAGHLHDFEEGKREFIGSHGRTPILLVQGPPGTGKSYSTAFAVFARLQGAMQAEAALPGLLSCKTHAATDVLMKNVLEVREKLRELRDGRPEALRQALRRPAAGRAALPGGPPRPAARRGRPPGQGRREGEGRAEERRRDPGASRGRSSAVTPGGIYGMLKEKWPQGACSATNSATCLVLDEASQMNLPEAIMAALPLKPDAPLIVVGDHRQMPPIVKHDWDARGPPHLPAVPGLRQPVRHPAGARTRR